MKAQLIRGSMSLTLGCICGLVNPASASEREELAMLDEVVVSATKTKISLSDAPAAVSVVTAKNIETKNASRLGDVLNQVPSLYVRGGALGQSQGTIGTSGMSLRGVDQNKTLILLDGQSIQDSNTGKVNWRIPFLDDIERVEVVPGAFSSLYGSNAIGGVVSIITKKPDRHELTVKVRKGWKDASGEDASIYWREKLNNGFGIVIGAGRQQRDSYVNDFVVRTVAGTGGVPVTGAQKITTRDGTTAFLVGDKGTTPWTSTNATAKLFYSLSDRDQIYTGIAHQETKQSYTRFNTYLRNTNAAGAPVYTGTANINGPNVTLAEWYFVNNSPLQEAATRYFVGYDGTAGDDYLLKIDLAKIKRTYSFTFPGTAATWSSGTGTLYDTPNDGLDGTAQLTIPLDSKQVLVTGLALHSDTSNQQVYALSNWRDPNARTGVNSSFNGNSTMTSLFAQDEISAAEALKVYLGGRLDNWKTKGDSKSGAIATLFPERSATAFSPKVSAVYRLNEAATLRASLGRSFRAPTHEDMYSTSVSVSGGVTKTTKGDHNLQPERGTTWEAGGDFHITESTKFTATYYETQLTSMIYLKNGATLANNTALSERINAGKARIRGVELASATRLVEWLRLDANYSYIDSRMLENAADSGSVGKRLTDSPKNIAGIGLTAEQGSWTGTLNARYVSHIFSRAINDDVVEGVPGSYDAHTMVDAKVGYAFTPMVKGSVAINNLLDKKAYSYFLLPGRNMTAKLVFSF